MTEAKVKSVLIAGLVALIVTSVAYFLFTLSTLMGNPAIPTDIQLKGTFILSMLWIGGVLGGAASVFWWGLVLSGGKKR